LSHQAKQLDGRRQRSEASRERIVQAMLELIGTGEIMPGAELVAARAGVGLRTVFRHFDNMESLYQEIGAVIAAEILPMAQLPFEAKDWRGRILEMIGRRAQIFERIMPFKIAADVHRHQSPFVQNQGVEFVRLQRAPLARILPESTRANTPLVESLDLVLSFEAWRRLRKDQKLSVARARQTLVMLVGALLKDE
jgi:AcrR family transcriptional regulator